MLSPGLAWLAQCPYKQQKNKQQSQYHLPAKQKHSNLFRGGSRILGGGALVSCSTSTPINQIVFFSQNTSCIRKPQVISGGGGGGGAPPPPPPQTPPPPPPPPRTSGTLPLDPPLLLTLTLILQAPVPPRCWMHSNKFKKAQFWKR